MDWRLRSAAFRWLDRLPGGGQAYRLLQGTFSRRLRRSAASGALLEARARRAVAALARHGGRPASEATALEIGAGRDLALSLRLARAGLGRVLAVDRTRHLRLGPLRAQIAVTFDAALATRCRGADDLPGLTGVRYLAPADAAAPPGVAPGTLDLVISNSVLEHIPPEAIVPLHRALAGLLRPDGLLIHRVDYSDHYSHTDRRLSRFNFLTFEAAAWQRHNAGLHFQNRLRHSQVLALLREAGFAILEDDPEVFPPEPAILARLAPDFASLPPADLFTNQAWIVARRV
jgi:SAM-dependent methyltransferase